MKELNLTQGSVPKVLLQFAVPFLIANILQALYGGADLFVVGQYDDSASVAASRSYRQSGNANHYGNYPRHYNRHYRTDRYSDRLKRQPAGSFHNRIIRVVVLNYRGCTNPDNDTLPQSDSRMDAYSIRSNV